MDELALAMLTLGAWVFTTSAAAKVRGRRAYRAFLAGLGESGLVPRRALPATAAALAVREAAIGVSLAAAAAADLATGRGAVPWAEAALALAAVLTTVLATGVAVVVRRGAQAPCACFGARPGRPLGRAHLVRNLVLLAAIGTGLVTSPLAGGPGAPAAAALGVAAGSVAALVIIRWEDLADLFSPGVAVTAPLRAPASTPATRRWPG
jgi:hypothetical protein